MTPFPGCVIALLCHTALCWILFTFKLPKANRTTIKVFKDN